MFNKLTLTYLLVFSMVMLSCGKKDAGTLDLIISKLDANDSKNIACSNLNLKTNVLRHQNIIYFFNCIGWNEKYKHLFAAITKIEPQKWDHIFLPIDHYYVSDTKKRDELFGLLKDLDQKGGLDQAHLLVEETFKKNPFVLLNKFLNISNQSNKNLIEIFNSDSKQINDFIKIFELMVSLINNEDTNFIPVFRKLLAQNEFKELRLKILNDLFKTIENKEYNDVDLKIVNQLLTQKTAYNWINSPDLTFKEFNYLVNYPVKTNPNLTNNLRSVYSVFPNAKCTIKDLTKFNIVIVIQKEFEKYLINLAKGEYEDFFKFVLKTASQLSLAEDLCGISKNFNGFNIFGLIEELSSLLENQNYFKIAAYLQSVINNNTDVFYMFRLLDSSLVNDFLDLNKFFIENKYDEINKKMFVVARSVNEENYEIIAENGSKLLTQKNFQTVKTIAKFWNGLTNEEKKYILSLTEAMLSEKFDIKLVLPFLNYFVQDSKNILPFLAKEWAVDENQKNLTVESLKQISVNLAVVSEDNGIESDLSRLISRDEILKMMDVISRGVVLESHKEFVFEVSKIKTTKNLETKGFKGKNLVVASVNGCIKALFKENKIANFVTVFPAACEGLTGSDYTLKALKAINLFKNDFENYKKSKSILFSNEGFLSEKNISESFVNGILLKNEGNLKGIIAFIQDENNTKTLEKSLVYLDKVLTALPPEFDNYLNWVKGKVLELTIQQSVNFLTEIQTLLADYDTYKFTMPKFIEKNKCTQYFRDDLGITACPKKETIKREVYSMYQILNRTFDGQESMLESMIDMFDPAQMTEQTLWQFYDLGTNFDDVQYFYSNDKEDYQTIKMSMADQVEITVRDIGFKGDFYGLIFLNGVSRAKVYQDKVKSSLSLFKIVKGCLNGVVSFVCAPILSGLGKEAKYLSKNVVHAFPSLIKIDDGFYHNGKLFRYGEFTQKILGTMVETSGKKAKSFSQFSIPTSKYLQEHNGEFLLKLAQLSAIRNGSRYVLDRFGSEANLTEVLNSVEYQTIMAFVEKNSDKAKIKRLIKELQAQFTEEEIKQEIEQIVDFIYDLNYEETRMLEMTLVNVVYVLAHIEKNDWLDFTKNNIKDLVKFYKLVKKYLPSDIHFKSYIKDLYKYSSFMKDQIKDKEKVKLLNRYYMISSDLIFNQIGKYNGLQLINIFIEKNPEVAVTQTRVILSEIFENKSFTLKKFMELNRDFITILQNKYINIDNAFFTMKKMVMEEKELRELHRFLIKVDQTTQESNLQKIMKSLFVSEFENIKNYISEVFDHIQDDIKR